MQKLVKIVAAALAVACLAGCSLVQRNSDRVIIAQVKDFKITLTDYWQVAFPNFDQYGISPFDTTQQESIDYITDSSISILVSRKIRDFKMEEYGIQEVEGDREDARVRAQAVVDDQYQVRYDAYREQYPEATHEEADADATEWAGGMFNETYTFEDYVEDTLQTILTERLVEQVTQDIVVTDEDVKAEYDKRVADEKTAVEADYASFETTLENSETVYYAPENYFYIKHILITIPDDKAVEVSTLRSEDKDAHADALLEEELAKIQEKADAVLAKVDAGDDFQALIDEYGEDPGMKSEPYKTQGYIMYTDCAKYMQPFTDAALALTSNGQTSGLVATDYGYHILKRVSSIAPGAIPYEMVQADLYEEILTQKRNEAFQAKMQQWYEEMGVKIWKDRIKYE